MNEPDDPIRPDAIRSLDSRTIERIAAGEVVERPASAVKELVENSLDAGADRIAVDIEAGGVDKIVVRDDGVGMTEQALRKAIERHTTSKLRGPDELERGIETLGFRGEALYTIAAVARLTIRTRPHGTTAGTLLRVAGGDVETVEPVGCPAGTTVEVEELFYNTPARREYLHTTTTEFDHVNRVVANYALANPAVALSLRHDGREVFTTPGQNDLAGTVMAVWGREVAEAMISIEREFDEGPLHGISGHLSEPETTRSRPRFVSTFVNGRYVRSGVLRDAILDGYGHHLASDRYPFVVLFCSISPDTVDVNVHPRKLEVRFQDEATVAERVTTAVRKTLTESGVIRSTSARGRGVPAETRTPPIDTQERAVVSSTDRQPTSPSLPARRREDNRRFRGGTEQRTLGDETPVIETTDLPDLDVLGQFDETYIVASSADGLVLIDQHAADERIHYERLREHFRGAPETQTLVTPVDLPLTPDEATTASALREPLEKLGFDYQVDGDQVRLTGVPAVIDAGADPELFRDALGAWVAGEAAETVESRTDELLADLACYPAITGHTRLSDGSVVSLLESLDACEDPYFCPHGRPVLIRIDQDELDDRFERDYPGHAERRQEASE